jgi:hypothetical protein
MKAWSPISLILGNDRNGIYILFEGSHLREIVQIYRLIRLYIFNSSSTMQLWLYATILTSTPTTKHCVHCTNLYSTMNHFCCISHGIQSDIGWIWYLCNRRRRYFQLEPYPSSFFLLSIQNKKHLCGSTCAGEQRHNYLSDILTSIEQPSHFEYGWADKYILESTLQWAR